MTLTPESNLAQSEWMENYKLGTAQMPSRTCCPFQASPLHSQWHPGSSLGHDQALEHRTLVSPCSSQGKNGMLGMSLRHPSEWRHPRTPSFCMGLQTGGSSLSPATYRTSSPLNARKAPSSMQLIWFLSSCLQEKGEKKGKLLGQLRQRAISAPDHFCCLLPLDLTPNSLMPNTARTHRFLRSVAPRNAFLGMAWMKFSLRSLQKKEARRQMGSDAPWEQGTHRLGHAPALSDPSGTQTNCNLASGPWLITALLS